MKLEDLTVWQKARALVKTVYEITRQQNFNKDWPLRDQIRRAATSILLNIAEGHERDGKNEFIHFLSIAKGSAGEVRTACYVMLDLNYIDKDEFDKLYGSVTEVSRMLSGLMKYLKESNLKGIKFK